MFYQGIGSIPYFFANVNRRDGGFSYNLVSAGIFARLLNNIFSTKEKSVRIDHPGKPHAVFQKV